MGNYGAAFVSSSGQDSCTVQWETMVQHLCLLVDRIPASCNGKLWCSIRVVWLTGFLHLARGNYGVAFVSSSGQDSCILQWETIM